jgi:hypothetical protein
MSATTPLDPTPPASAGDRAAYQPSRAERVVDRLARRTARRGVSRRSFLVRAAVIGSALTVAPLRWIMRPTSAYASICGEGASCGQGWTAFCCTINRGANTCPPGSYVAGWWKIDRSPFCADAPRYIVDCNRTPGASCTCRCASGSCDQRRVCCNNFRYGQCNTQVPGVTEVVCRVVICTTPWTWDPACGRTVRTDNRTTTHNAPCLPGTNPSPIALYYQDLGLTGSVLGAPLAGEASGPRGGAWRRYDHGVLVQHPNRTVRMLQGATARQYVTTGGPGGSLGYVTGDTGVLGGGRGTRTAFERGDIYERDDDAVALLGPTAARYRSLDGPAGVLGSPTAGTAPVGDGRGSVTRFANGTIYASGRTGAQELIGPIDARFTALGGPDGSGLGYPLVAIEGSARGFERGLLVTTSGGVFVLRDRIAQRYAALGGASGPWGALQRDQDRAGGADRAVFAAATVFAGEGAPPVALSDPVLAAYLDAGGPAGSLGLPTVDSFRTRLGHHRGTFTGGSLEIHRTTGEVRRTAGRPTRSPSDLTR